MTQTNSISAQLEGKVEFPALRQRHTPSEIELGNLKIQNNQLEIQILQLKSKISKMKQTLNDRDKSVKHVMSNTQEIQPIQTTSPSQIHQLKLNLHSLQNTLNKRQDELDQVQQDDRTTISEELQEELKVTYVEKIRLTKINQNVNDANSLLLDEKNRLITIINSIPKNEKLIRSNSQDINLIKEKLGVYWQGLLKIEATEIATDIINQSNEKVKQHKTNIWIEKLNQEIQKYDDEILKLQQSIEKIQQFENENIQYLQELINEQYHQLQEAVKQITQENTIPNPKSH